MLRIAFGPFFLSDLWASWAVSGASWDHLGAVLGRLAASWSRPGTTSGRSWAVLGASWGVLVHLGGVLGASWGVLGASWGCLGGFVLNVIPEIQKILKTQYFFYVFVPSDIREGPKVPYVWHFRALGKLF